jgi:hypothetical protein
MVAGVVEEVGRLDPFIGPGLFGPLGAGLRGVSLRSDPFWQSEISLTVAAGTDLERIADVLAATLPT